MFCGPVEKPTAKVAHRCTSCGEQIDVGSKYVKWTSFDDGSAFTNKMHPECHDAHEENARHWGDSEWEYSPFSHARGTAE